MRKSFWLGLSLINLSIVALFGFGLRSKILFTIHFIDYRSLLSAHSHFAFGGWVGLALITLLIYNLLPSQIHRKKIYQAILIGIEISAMGMALFFPIQGYSTTAIVFSSLYIVMTYVFGWVFIKDVLKLQLNKSVKLLSISAISSLLISAIGPLGLSYILLSGSGNATLYRDSIYTFLHFQYNGFFTLSVFALFFHHLYVHKTVALEKTKVFAFLLVLSIVPSLFLSLLWHNKTGFYVLALAGSLLILLSLFYFLRWFISFPARKIFSSRLAYDFFLFSFISFALKMLLNAGTIIPQLSNEVYGDRPVIIGFLHLVFLGFVTFFILSQLVEEGYYSLKPVSSKIPLYIFSAGIFGNELFLMAQGLSILFNTNYQIYQWLLWFAAIFLFTGALLIAITYYIQKSHRKLPVAPVILNDVI
jgi:hypothetical protein